MKALKLKIQSIKNKVSDLEKNRNKLKSSIEHSIVDISSYQQKINKALLNRKSNSNFVKISLSNEQLIETHSSLMQSIINNKDKLIQIQSSKERQLLINPNANNTNSNINTVILTYESSIQQLNKEISNVLKSLRSEFKFESFNHIINPTKETLENYNEICIQKELMTKFKKKSIETRSNISERSKVYSSLSRELKCLKQEKGIKDLHLSTNESTIVPDIESIGSLDNEIENNIDSPKFLKKVKQVSKIDFAFNRKLELNVNKLRQLAIERDQGKGKEIHNNDKPVQAIMKIEHKKSENQLDKDCLCIKKSLTLDQELEQSRESIKALTQKLGELLYNNRVLELKKKEADNKMEEMNKKIRSFEALCQEEEKQKVSDIDDNANDNSSSDATDEIDVLANVHLYPLPV